ncbi:MAG TPA: hypothetical protein VG713_05860, partial [Pirellulales bacterium]|nr:hypothetical protein [Pirellulales bacterium]
LLPPSQRPKDGDKSATNAGEVRIVMCHCRVDWDAYRYNTRTGETWWPDTSKDPQWVWKKMADDHPPAESEFDLQAVYYLQGDNKIEQILRLDRNTGQTWWLDAGAWKSMAEPSSFAQTSPPQHGFRLLLISDGAGWQAFRFDAESGATWTTDFDKGNNNAPFWRTVADDDSLSAGSYDLQGVPYTDDGDVCRAVRIDRKSGRAWVALGYAWSAIAEPPEFAASAAPESGYRSIMNASTKYWYVYRLNPETGEMWLPTKGDNGTIWTKIPEQRALPRGSYDAQIVSWIEQTTGYHYVLRMERGSGRMWLSWDDRNWLEVVERNDFGGGAAPRGGYRLLSSCSEKGWYALRVDLETGATWAPNLYDDRWIADRWEDDPPLERGSYDFGMVSFIDGNDGTENVYRIDRDTGDVWVYNEKWKEIIAQKTLQTFNRRPANGYQLILCPSPTACTPFRFDATNGITWTPNPSQPMLWKPIEEREQLPANGYALSVISYQGDKDATFVTVLRTDPSTGKSWYAANNKWTAIDEPQ